MGKVIAQPIQIINDMLNYFVLIHWIGPSFFPIYEKELSKITLLHKRLEKIVKLYNTASFIHLSPHINSEHNLYTLKFIISLWRLGEFKSQSSCSLILIIYCCFIIFFFLFLNDSRAFELVYCKKFKKINY